MYGFLASLFCCLIEVPGCGTAFVKAEVAEGSQPAVGLGAGEDWPPRDRRRRARYPARDL